MNTSKPDQPSDSPNPSDLPTTDTQPQSPNPLRAKSRTLKDYLPDSSRQRKGVWLTALGLVLVCGWIGFRAVNSFRTLTPKPLRLLPSQLTPFRLKPPPSNLGYLGMGTSKPCALNILPLMDGLKFL